MTFEHLTLTVTFDIHLENFNSKNFSPYDIGLSYFAFVFFFLQYLFVGTINFGHVTLTLTFDLHLDKFNSPQNFLTIRHRTFIFGVCVPYIKTFLVVT